MNSTSIAERVRSLILEVAEHSQEPTHLGGSLSSVEIMSVLFSKVMKFSALESKLESEDLFILSKGHCYLGLLATLCEIGRLTKKELLTYQSEDGVFGAHPIMGQTPDIVSSNGSLGHGLGFGLGIAFQKKIDAEPGTVFVLMGDSECSEGSVLESALLAPELGVSNLVAIIDSNSFGNDGALAYGSAKKVAGAFAAFGWDVCHVNGHSEPEILEALNQRKPGLPKLLLASTVKGKGWAEVEGTNESHHIKFIKRSAE